MIEDLRKGYFNKLKGLKIKDFLTEENIELLNNIENKELHIIDTLTEKHYKVFQTYTDDFIITKIYEFIPEERFVFNWQNKLYNNFSRNKYLRISSELSLEMTQADKEGFLDIVDFEEIEGKGYFIIKLEGRFFKAFYNEEGFNCAREVVPYQKIIVSYK